MGHQSLVCSGFWILVRIPDPLVSWVICFLSVMTKLFRICWLLDISRDTLPIGFMGDLLLLCDDKAFEIMLTFLYMHIKSQQL